MDPAREASRNTTTSTGKAGEFGTLLPNLVAGVIIGIAVVLWTFTLAALIFGDALQPFMLKGAGFLLIGSTIIVLVMSLTSSYTGSIGMSEEAAGVILSLIAATLGARIGHDLDAEAAFATVLAIIGLSTLLSGLVFLGLGHFRLGNLVRFIPHPVIGGVVVTMAWLLVVGAFSVMTGIDLSLDNIELLFFMPVFHKWAPGVVFAFAMLAMMRRRNHYLMLPSMLIGALALFYVATIALGLPIGDLRSSGWLMGPVPDESMLYPADLKLVTQVDWSAVLSTIPDIAGLVLLCVLSLLLTATALEVAVKCDMDLNRELKSAGIANILAGFSCGITGAHSLEDSLVAREIGSTNRIVGVVAALVCALAFFAGASLLSYLPRPLLGGFILYFGLILLVEWVYEAWFRLPRADYFVVLLCLTVSVTHGYLEGIGVGIIAGIVIFVINYSQVDVVKHAVSGARFRSNVSRDPASRDLLNRHGERILILKLQGFIFFGTAHHIYTRIVSSSSAATHQPLRFVLLDFSRVSGMDISALASFEKMRQLAMQSGFHILFTHLNEAVSTRLEQSDSLLGDPPLVRVFPDLDFGLEWCEDILLNELGGSSTTEYKPLSELLEESFPDPELSRDLMAYLEQQSLDQGDVLIRQGEPSSDLYFIESGRVAIAMEVADHPPIRLRSLGAGTVVGEVAMFLGQPRSASVIAERPTRVFRLTREALDHIRKTNPALSSAFNEYIARLLATRLVDTNSMLGAVIE